MKKKNKIIAAAVIAVVILVAASIYLVVRSSHENEEIESTSGTTFKTEPTGESTTNEREQPVSLRETDTAAASTTIKPAARTTAKSVPQTKQEVELTTRTTTTTTTAPDTADKMTMAQFDRIKEGMIYEQVLAIAGMPPKSTEETNGEFVCHWDAEGQLYPNGKPPVATVQFQNGLVHSKICLIPAPRNK